MLCPQGLWVNLAVAMPFIPEFLTYAKPLKIKTVKQDIKATQRRGGAEG